MDEKYISRGVVSRGVLIIKFYMENNTLFSLNNTTSHLKTNGDGREPMRVAYTLLLVLLMPLAAANHIINVAQFQAQSATYTPTPYCGPSAATLTLTSNQPIRCSASLVPVGGGAAVNLGAPSNVGGTTNTFQLAGKGVNTGTYTLSHSCQTSCGDGSCTGAEGTGNCPQDCGCGSGLYWDGVAHTCESACPTAGNGYGLTTTGCMDSWPAGGGEASATVSPDYYCPNNGYCVTCDWPGAGISGNGCWAWVAGDSVCRQGLGETWGNSPWDCEGTQDPCNYDGSCNTGEDSNNCPSDCWSGPGGGGCANEGDSCGFGDDCCGGLVCGGSGTCEQVRAE
jgi:hypothetical protein